MKKLYVLLLSLLAFFGQAQISGFKNIPSANYPTIQAAFDSLNTYGVGGPVVFTIQGGYTENITSPLVLNATGASNAPIIFQWDSTGAKPQIIRTDAGSQNTSTVGGYGDAIIQLNGSDYVTFKDLYLIAQNQGIEYGILTHKPSATNGCQNVNIIGCKIQMTKGTSAYVAGIYIGNGTTSPSSATGVTVSNSDGKNKYILLHRDTIINAQMGFYVRGSSAMYDSVITITHSSVSNYAAATNQATYGAYFIYVQNPTVTSSEFISANHTSTLYGVFFSTVSGNVECSNNNFVLSNVSTSSNTNFIYNANFVNSETYRNNTFSAPNISSTETVYVIYSSNATQNKSIIGNILLSMNRTATSGTVYGYYNYGTPTGGTEIITDNAFMNVSLAGTSTFYGIYTYTASGHSRVIKKNVVSNINIDTGTFYGINATTGSSVLIDSNMVTNITAGGTVYGLYVSGFANSNTRYNMISNITTSGGSLYGIYFTGGTTGNLSNNIIKNLTSTNSNPTVTGIYVNGPSQITNSLVSELYAPNVGNNTNAVRGIDIGSSASNVRLYFNTIYLDATASTATNFGTSALNVNVTPTVELKNNIIIDNSRPVGTGFSVAYRRSGTNLTSYSSASNNNIFYADTSAANPNCFIYHDGTNGFRNFAGFYNHVKPREEYSQLELTPFVNTSTFPYDLHVKTNIPTFAEGGGTPIPGITKDIEDNDRDPSFPDIGADEFNGTPRYTCQAPHQGPTTASSEQVCFGESVTLSVSQLPGSGVVYQWQISTDGGTTFHDISGLNNYSVNIVPTEPAFYRAMTVCKAGPDTAYSIPVFIDFVNKVLTVVGDTVCGPQPASLHATGTSGSTIAWFSAPIGGTLLDTGSVFTTSTITTDTMFYAAAFSPFAANISIGAGALTSSSYESPFNHLYGGLKTQYLIRASELLNAGLFAGPIYSLSFEVVSPGTTYQNLTVSIGTTSANTMTTTFISGLTPVFGPTAYTPVAGTNTITFNNAFIWDGTSNLVVEFCWSNNNTGGTSTTVKYDNTTYVSEAYFRADNMDASTLCAQTAATGTLSNRPKFTLNGTSICSSPRVAVPVKYTVPPAITINASSDTICVGQQVTLTASSSNGGYNYTWLPDNITGNPVTVSPTTSTNFTAQAHDPVSGCVTQANYLITVGNIFPSIQAISATPATVCSGALVDLFASYSDGTYIYTDTILRESFESGTIPSMWIQELDVDGNSTSATFYVQGSSTHPTGFSPTDGNYLLRFNSWSVSSGNKARLSTSISSYGYQNLVVSFDWTKDNGYTNNDRVIVQYSFNGTTWYSLDSVSRYGSPNRWERVTFSLPSILEDTVFYLGFLFVSAYGNDCHMDNISVYGETSGTLPSTIYWTSSPNIPLPNSTVIDDVAVNQTTTFTFHVTNMYRCEVIADVTVNVMPAPSIAIFASANPICEGTTTTLTATSSFSDYIYTWSTGDTSTNIDVTPAVTTIYTVTGYDPITNCEATQQITVNVIPYPVVDLPDTIQVHINNDRILDAGNPGATYLWIDVQTGQVLGTNQTLTVNSSTAGTQYIALTVTNGGMCSASDTVQVIYFVFLAEYNYGMHIFPNPTSDNINITFKELPTGTYTVEVISATGSLISRETIYYTGNRIQMNFSTYPTGQYLLRFIGNEHQVNVPFIITR